MVRCNSTLPKAGPNLRARRLLVEGTAKRRAQAEAERGIGRVGLLQHQQMVRRGADIADRDQRRGAELPLHAEHPVLGVGSYVARVHRGNAHQRLELAPVHVGVGIGAAGAEGTFCSGKRCPALAPVAATVKGAVEERRRGGGVGVAVGRVGAHDARREPFVSGIEDAVAGADAGLAGSAESFTQPGAGECRRPREAQARRKVVARRGKRAGNAGVAGKDQAHAARRDRPAIAPPGQAFAIGCTSRSRGGFYPNVCRN